MRNPARIGWLCSLLGLGLGTLGGLTACRRNEGDNSAQVKEMAPNSVTSPPVDGPEDEKPTHPEDTE